MDKLKRKIDVLSALNRKSEVRVEAIQRTYILHKKRLRDAKDALSKLVNELESCNQKISENYLAQINIDSIQRVNSYCDKLVGLIDGRNQMINDMQSRLDETKKKLEKELTKGKFFSKAVENVTNKYTQNLQKSFDKSVEDIWLSRRVEL